MVRLRAQETRCCCCCCGEELESSKYKSLKQSPWWMERLWDAHRPLRTPTQESGEDVLTLPTSIGQKGRRGGQGEGEGRGIASLHLLRFIWEGEG